jgi:hypothetical protein
MLVTPLGLGELLEDVAFVALAALGEVAVRGGLGARAGVAWEGSGAVRVTRFSWGSLSS